MFEGDDEVSEIKENEDSPPTQGLQLGTDTNEAKHPSLMEENDGGDARISKFDLNEVPVDEDAEDWA